MPSRRKTAYRPAGEGLELIAYDATNVSKVLWSAPLPDYSHFAIPTITSDGHVFAGVGNDLVAFGLSQPG